MNRQEAGELWRGGFRGIRGKRIRQGEKGQSWVKSGKIRGRQLKAGGKLGGSEKFQNSGYPIAGVGNMGTWRRGLIKEADCAGNQKKGLLEQGVDWKGSRRGGKV